MGNLVTVCDFSHPALSLFYCSNVLQVSTETPRVCSWASVFPATAMAIQTNVWMGLEFVW